MEASQIVVISHPRDHAVVFPGGAFQPGKRLIVFSLVRIHQPDPTHHARTMPSDQFAPRLDRRDEIAALPRVHRLGHQAKPFVRLSGQAGLSLRVALQAAQIGGAKRVVSLELGRQGRGIAWPRSVDLLDGDSARTVACGLGLNDVARLAVRVGHALILIQPYRERDRSFEQMVPMPLS